MTPSSTLSSLVVQSSVLTPEKKQVYSQVLSYLSPEASSQLEALLSGAEEKIRQVKEQEQIALSQINATTSEEMKELVRVELQAAQAQAEADESKVAEDILTKLDNL